MNFTEEVKNELIEIQDEPCCKNAGLSAYVKGAGTLEVAEGKIGFSLSSDNVKVLNYFAKVLDIQYSEEPYNVNKVKRIKAEFFSENTAKILSDLGIIDTSNGDILLNFGIDKYIIENDCCKRAYIRGAFLAGGSVTIPDKDKKIGYHLEFVFSNYTNADDFCLLLSSLDFLPKLIERKGYVVYFNSSKEICDILALMGAEKALKKVQRVISVKKSINDSNRRINCDLSNISKQVNAFLKQKEAIRLIEQTIGLDSLGQDLQLTAKARLENPDSSLDALSQMLNISKSCLNHRLRKIVEISRTIS